MFTEGAEDIRVAVVNSNHWPGVLPGREKKLRKRDRAKSTKNKQQYDWHITTGLTSMCLRGHFVPAKSLSLRVYSLRAARPVSLQAALKAFTLIMALLCFSAPHKK
ncbi:hypothetical protein AMECASPLE_018494 [Ameca splendens]|uniref:Uncharacterized protein n=1 Tax=Ameca splendens TaxID=208324 RepID=A0ABV0ZYH2_9TELE